MHVAMALQVIRSEKNEAAARARTVGPRAHRRGPLPTSSPLAHKQGGDQHTHRRTTYALPWYSAHFISARDQARRRPAHTQTHHVHIAVVLSPTSSPLTNKQGGDLHTHRRTTYASPWYSAHFISAGDTSNASLQCHALLLTSQ